MRLLLARHGRTDWNDVRRFQGTTDVGLSELGRRQAEALGQAVRGRRLAAAYVSPMVRALETATIALEGTGVPIVPVDELRELSLGEWEGYTVDEISRRDGDPYRRWVRAPLDCPPPGGEALPEVCGRVLRAIEGIGTARRDGDVLIVAHGGIISVYLCHLLGCSFNELWRLRVDNASLTTVEPPRIVTLNETFHLIGHRVTTEARYDDAGSSAGFARAIDSGGRQGGASQRRATTVGRGAKPPSEETA